MPKIFALRSRLLEVQNSLLCNPLAHGVGGKGDGVDPCHAHDGGARGAQVGQQPTWACGTEWDEDWGSSLLVGDHHAAASNSDIIEVPEPEVVAEEEKGEGEDDTGKIA